MSLNNTKEKSVFDEFTNRYALSKTLRFELKPEGKTLENMRAHLKYDESLQTFLADQEIEDAYQVLKPVFDNLHKDFINNSLSNEEAKKLNFKKYFDIYKKYKVAQDRDEKIKIQKILDDEGASLRKKFSSLYEKQGEEFKDLVGKEKKKKDKEEYILKEKGFKTLTEAGILKYIKNNLDYFVSLNLKTRDGDEIKKEDLEKALGTAETKGVFEGFFTYFGGFNQNRENYYSTDEKATAVANRVVSQNLPKFCDNSLIFQNNKATYIKADEFLENKGIALLAKGQNGDDIKLHKINEKIFEIDHFVHCFTQEEIDTYNLKIGNANNLINRYNQQQEDKRNKLKLLKTLYKQIGCGDKGEFIPSIKDFDGLKEIFSEAATDSKQYFIKVDDFISHLKNHETYENVFWSDRAINIISAKYFSDWHTLKEKLGEAKVLSKNTGKDKDENKYKLPQAVQLKDLFEQINTTEDWQSEGILFKKSLFENAKQVEKLKQDNPSEYEKDRFYNELAIKKLEIILNSKSASEALICMIFADIESKKELFNSLTGEVLEITEDKKDKSKQSVKQWLDAILAINQMIKYWKVKDTYATEGALEEKIKAVIYSEENPTRFYDLVRNDLTKKPTEELNKLKLNFENGQLLGGWSDGQEKNKASVILKKDGKYYLGILKKKNIFDTEKNYKEIYTETGNAGRLILMNLKFQTLAGKGFMSDNNQESYGDMGKRDSMKAVSALQKLIVERGYSKRYPKLKTVAEKNYVDKKTFDLDVQDSLKECYVCEFKKIDWSKVEEYINSGDIFVFEIYSRQKAMQNWYWREVFRDESTIQLLGGAEIFYRPSNDKIKRNVKRGYENKKDEITGKNYIIEDKRFTVEKFLFHCPIKLNYKEKSYSNPKFALSEVNKNINSYLINHEKIYFLGIDRGEKHLAYYSLVDQNGKIIKQGSFNTIKDENTGKEHNYAEKLEKLAGNRDEARKNWETIGTIKELKDGYISQVIRKIVDIAIENNALIVLENLNVGFKRGRQKIEKQVYQKLELALAKKLNFLVDKSAQEGETLSVSKALQLTPQVNNFGDIEGKSQFGIMLYTKADYTSQTDPVTGWRKIIYLKKGSEEFIKEQIINNFDDFGFDGSDYYFTYTDPNTKKQWTLYSGQNGKSLDRYHRELTYENSEKRWTPKKQDLAERLDRLFEGFDKDRSLHSQIVDEGLNPNKIELHTAWESLRFTIDLIQQIRNTGNSDRDEDFILSPVRDKYGNHFDSRIHLDGGDKATLPVSGDANGAYNIARKGIMMLERIKENSEKPNLYISNVDWDKFSQSNN
jgi:hypothetical protein